MCAEQKAMHVHAGAAVGFELTCILFFFLSSFSPFPYFSFFFKKTTTTKTKKKQPRVSW